MDLLHPLHHRARAQVVIVILVIVIVMIIRTIISYSTTEPPAKLQTEPVDFSR